jgi:hypothetical protein
MRTNRIKQEFLQDPGELFLFYPLKQYSTFPSKSIDSQTVRNEKRVENRFYVRNKYHSDFSCFKNFETLFKTIIIIIAFDNIC